MVYWKHCPPGDHPYPSRARQSKFPSENLKLGTSLVHVPQCGGPQLTSDQGTGIPHAATKRSHAAKTLVLPNK